MSGYGLLKGQYIWMLEEKNGFFLDVRKKTCNFVAFSNGLKEE
jgi:hypothetical protein